MALTFPASPTDGQIYTDGDTGRTFKYSGARAAWEPQGGDSAPVFFTTKPVAPVQGQVYYDEVTDTLEVYSDTTAAWEKVEAPPTALWNVTANGTTDYIFSGVGFAGTELDPTITVIRGQTYTITNATGAHPFQIQATQGLGGMPYNDGVTNNGVSNGTLTWEVRMDAPDTLYYQCTTHAGMNGIINVLNVGGASVSSATTLTEGIVYGYIDSGDGDAFYGYNVATSFIAAPSRGTNNTVIGYSSFNTAIDSTYCVGIGSYLLGSLTSGSNNIAIGDSTGTNLSTGNFNIAIGNSVLTGVDTGVHNVAIGSQYSGITLSGADSNNLILGSYQGVVGQNGYVSLSRNGTNNVLFQINNNNAYGVPTTSTNNNLSVDFGTAGQVLTSQGNAAPPQWAAAAGGTSLADSQISEGEPITRSDGSALVAGDLYFEGAQEGYFFQSGTTWRNIGPTIRVNPSPPSGHFRSSGAAAKTGDLYIDTFNERLYYSDGSNYNLLPGGPTATPTTVGTVYGYSSDSAILGQNAGQGVYTLAEGGVYIGYGAGQNLTSDGSYNVIVGGFSFQQPTAGTYNTIIGGNALDDVAVPATLNNATVLGAYDGSLGIADDEVIIAAGSGGLPKIRMAFNASGALSVGNSRTATGTSGQVLTSQGSGSAPTWTTVSGGGSSATPTAEGIVYAYTPTNGVYLGFNNSINAAAVNVNNVVIGDFSGDALTTGSDSNVIVGNSAGFSLTGTSNTLLGYGSGDSITTGVGNIILGHHSGISAAANSQFVVTQVNPANRSTDFIKLVSNEFCALGFPTVQYGNAPNYGQAGQVLTSQGSSAPPVWTTSGFAVVEMGSTSVSPFPQEWLVQDSAITGPITFTLPNVGVQGAVKFSFATGNTQNITFSGAGSGANTFNGTAGNLVLTGAQVDGKTFTFTYVSQLVGWAVEGL